MGSGTELSREDHLLLVWGHGVMILSLGCTLESPADFKYPDAQAVAQNNSIRVSWNGAEAGSSVFEGHSGNSNVQPRLKHYDLEGSKFNH